MSRDFIWLDKNYGTWKGLKTNIIKLEEDDFDDPKNLEGMIKMMNFFKFNQMSNQLLLKKSLVFALHYVNFKKFIMTHQQPPLCIEAYDLEGSYLKNTQ